MRGRGQAPAASSSAYHGRSRVHLRRRFGDKGCRLGPDPSPSLPPGSRRPAFPGHFKLVRVLSSGDRHGVTRRAADPSCCGADCRRAGRAHGPLVRPRSRHWGRRRPVAPRPPASVSTPSRAESCWLRLKSVVTSCPGGFASMAAAVVVGTMRELRGEGVRCASESAAPSLCCVRSVGRRAAGVATSEQAEESGPRPSLGQGALRARGIPE